MNRIIFSFLFLLLSVTAMQAQKVGYINTETILNSIPEYISAEKQLKELNDLYVASIKTQTQEIDKMYREYQAIKSKLSEDQKIARENQIISKEREVKSLQNSYFGQDGKMSRRSEELLNPLKEIVQKAISQISIEGEYMLVFDLAANNGVIYSSPTYDLSNKVLQLLK